MSNLFQFLFVVICFCSLASSQVSLSYSPVQTTLSFRTVGGERVPFQNNMPLPGFEKQKSYREIIDLSSSNLKNEVFWKKRRLSDFGVITNHDISLQERSSGTVDALIKEADPTFQIISPFYDDMNWDGPTGTIPGCENKLHPGDLPEPFYDCVWYRCHFKLPGIGESKTTKLVFYSVNYICDIWVNGRYQGYHEGGYSPFSFDITNTLDLGDSPKECVIVIRVDNPHWYKSENCGTWNTFRNDIIPSNTYTDWFNFTGIIHDVYLEISNPLYVCRADVCNLDFESAGSKAYIRTRMTMMNGFRSGKIVDITLEIHKASLNKDNVKTEYASDLSDSIVYSKIYRKIKIGSKEVSVTKDNLIMIVNYETDLWRPAGEKLGEFANLYVIRFILKDHTSGEIYDDYYSQFGIRDVRIEKCMVLINKKAVFLTGISRHEEHPQYGRSLPIGIIYDDLKRLLLDGLNINWLRTAHYPNHPFTYLLADRLGIAVEEEIPQWWTTEEQFEYQNNIKKLNYQMFREMVFRDFNRPSIIQWSLCNESWALKGRIEFIKGVKDDISRNDYEDRRLIGQNANLRFPEMKLPKHDRSQDYCDFAGWSLYILNGDGKADIKQLEDTLKSLHSEYPDKPILISEFGPGNRSDFFRKVFNASSKYASVRKNGSLDETGFVMGVMYWVAFDFHTSNSFFLWNSDNGCSEKLNDSGVYLENRNPKSEIFDEIRSSYNAYFKIGGTTENQVVK